MCYFNGIIIVFVDLTTKVSQTVNLCPCSFVILESNIKTIQLLMCVSRFGMTSVEFYRHSQKRLIKKVSLGDWKCFRFGMRCLF